MVGAYAKRVRILVRTVVESTEKMRACTDPSTMQKHHKSMQQAMRQLKGLCASGLLGDGEKRVIRREIGRSQPTFACGCEEK